MAPQPHEEHFTLPVRIEGKESELPARLVAFPYTYKIYVETGRGELVFEPDEERNLRAVVQEGIAGNISAELVNHIGAALEQLLR
jgi:hypothetical protein